MKSRTSQARSQVIYLALFAIVAVLAATDVVSSELYFKLLPYVFILVGLSMIYTAFYLSTFYRRLFRVMFGVGPLLLAAPMLLPVRSGSIVPVFLGSLALGAGVIGVGWFYIIDMRSDAHDRG